MFKGPRGYNMVAEVDYFYPLPDSVEALRPKRKKLKPATTTPAPTPPPPPPFPEHIIEDYDHDNHIQYDHEYEHHPDIFVPQSGWRDEPNLAVLPDVAPESEVPTKGEDRIWSMAQSTPAVKKVLLQNNEISLILSSPSTHSPAGRSESVVPICCPTTTAQLELGTCSMDK